MTENVAIEEEILVEFQDWLKLQGRALRTIHLYSWALKNIPPDIEDYFSDPHLQSKDTRIRAYRSYLRFLAIKKKVISRNDLLDALETFKAPKKRGTSQNRKWSIPRSHWVETIRKAPNKVGKMGFWLGFQFGLRLDEILHLRVQDIDFSKQEILIQHHKELDNQAKWAPKYGRERQIPFTNEQDKILKRWIQEERISIIDHPYMLFTPRGPNKYSPLRRSTFQSWCTRAGIHAHVLRYSFAVYVYQASENDVKLVSELLGHQNVSITSEYLQLGKKNVMKKARKIFAGDRVVPL